MEVVDGLAAPATDVRDQPVAAIGDSLRARQLGGHREESPQQWTIGLDQVRRRPDMPARQEEDVGRGARCDIPDRDDEFVIMKPCRGDLGRHDPAEQAIGGVHQSTGFELIRKPMVPTRPAIR